MMLRLKKKWRENLVFRETGPAICDANTAASVFREALSCEHFLDTMREHMWAIGLDGKHRAKYIQLVTMGSWNLVVVDPRVIFQAALVYGCSAIILVHNHPSGDPEPSCDDIELTERMRDAGKIIGIKLLDHLVVGAPGKQFSLSDNGLI